MAQSRLFSIYERLPIWAQNVACTLAGYRIRRQRYNATFFRALEFLEKSQWWSPAEQLAYQEEQLQKLIARAYEHVPYYREVMDERKLVPADIRGPSDLGKLPLLDKATVRHRYDDLQARDWPAKRIATSKTGGTTGTALKLREDLDTLPWQWAVWWRHRRRFGLTIDDEFIVFAGRSVVPLSDMRPPFWRRNRPMHQTYVSIHHMLQQNMAALVEYLQTRQVAYYSGYPSGLYLLATYLREEGIKLRYPPRYVSTGAETLLPHQREVIEEALQTTVIDQYGASEHCGNLSSCAEQIYHDDFEFGYNEFLPLPGLPSEQRAIVCTGFQNPVMPLIRYQIGDVATMHPGDCRCGRTTRMVDRIDGRIESYIITPDGRQMGRLDFLFKDSANIEAAQLIQPEPDLVILKIVRTPRYSEIDEANLRTLLLQYLGDKMRYQFDYVEEIPRAANGKFRQIISSVYQDKFAAK